MSILSIGWDIGGWQGKNHGFALIGMEDGGEPELIGQPQTLRIPSGQKESGGLFELEDLVEELGEVQFSDYDKIVIAVDAPLGLPRAFKNFINDPNLIEKRPNREIDNPLAYRKTEQHIYRSFCKKPLSAPFGRLGTSMTVAMVHARHWAKSGFFVVPQQRSQKWSRQIHH